MSQDAASGKDVRDILQKDDQHIAIMLNEHLRWEHNKSRGDSFVSWTIYLTFALCYAKFKAQREETTLSEISICIIDTTKVPAGCFLRDLDLIEAYENALPGNTGIRLHGEQTTWFKRGLPNLLQLRQKVLTATTGYYFGEYLSQGKIGIHHCSCTVKSDKIINPNLSTLCPEFDSISGTKWVESTNQLRLGYAATVEPKQLEDVEITAAFEIINPYDRDWKLPMFAYLLALRRRSTNDDGLLLAFRKHFEGKLGCSTALEDDLRPTECDRITSLPSRTVIEDNLSLPEVMQFRAIMRAVAVDYIKEPIETSMKLLRGLSSRATPYIDICIAYTESGSLQECQARLQVVLDTDR